MELSELHGPPSFLPGARVRALRSVRNDGTHPVGVIGDVLIEEGAVGYVKSVGSYLNRFYVFAIDFIDSGLLVGMRTNELEEAP